MTEAEGRRSEGRVSNWRTEASDKAVDAARAMVAEHLARRARIAQERREREAEEQAYYERCKALNEAQMEAAGHSHRRVGKRLRVINRW